MGSRGASSGRTKNNRVKRVISINKKDAVKKEAIRAVRKPTKKIKENGFDKKKELSNFQKADYRKANTPRGAKSFLTMFQRQNLNGVLAHGEEYVIAKWAHSKGYKNLDKKSRKEIHKILSEYSNFHNVRLGNSIKSSSFKWYKYDK
nr:MAG TPA: hypothetical protein [Caudoviricetes sp.]